MDINLLINHSTGVKELEKKWKRKIKDSEEIANVQLPYIFTDTLIEQIMNLKYKQNGNTTSVERISSRIQKDIYSALLYGSFWIYLEEMKNMEYQEKRRSKVDITTMLNFIPPTTKKRRLY